MKHVYYTYLLTILMSMVGARGFAHDIEVANSDGKTIYYKISDATSVSVTYQGENCYSYPNEYSGDVVIPETITYGSKTYSVTSIDQLTFDGCSNLTSVTVGNRVTSIGSAAFSGCSGLTSVIIPNSVTSIGLGAFQGCSGLTSVTIPNSVTSIGNYSFEGTAWYDNQPEGLVYAGDFAYKYKGTMPANTSITLKEGTVGIASCAFLRCSGLTSVTIPNSVTSIGDCAFYDCSSLTSIDIPSSVTSIGKRVFVKCLALTSIKVQIENTKYDSREDCNAIIETASNTLVVGCKSSVIPNNVTTIGEYNQEIKGKTNVEIIPVSA